MSKIIPNPPPSPLRCEDMFHRQALDAAWRKVRGNGGGPGGDGVTLAAFGHEAGGNLDRLAAALASGRYRPGPLRRFTIPKASGGNRELAVPCIVDRVAQTAVLLALVPRLDGRLAEESFAYRPGRSVAQALALARRLIGDGLDWVVDADIRSFFDAVDQTWLVRFLEHRIADKRIIRLVQKGLKAGILEDGEVRVSDRGTGQGARWHHRSWPTSICTMPSISGLTAGDGARQRAT